MNRKSLYFSQPQEIEIIEEELSSPDKKEVLVETEYTSISTGTELLFYNDKIERNQPLDKKIDSLNGDFDYPIKYGYSAVGVIQETGSDVSKELLGKRVFSFNPHESHFLAKKENLIEIPRDITSKKATFIPKIETALNIAWDLSPNIGEKIAIFGQGVIGILTTKILEELPGTEIITFDKIEKRRKISEEFGAKKSLNPKKIPEKELNSYDLIVEVSGKSNALKKGIGLAQKEGKIVLGSWYGKNQDINLGTQFHRKRIKLISSQVSSIKSSMKERWDKKRRLNKAIDLLRDINMNKLITDEIKLEEAKKAYKKLNEGDEETLQVLFKYNE